MGLVNFCNQREFMKDQQVHYIHGEDGVTLTPCNCAQKRGFDFLSLLYLS